MRNVSDKIVDKIKTHILYSVTFSENRDIYEIMWTNIAERGRPQMMIWRMRIAYRVPKATDTHSECVLLIAFPRQQWLHERASILRLFVHCPSYCKRSLIVVSAIIVICAPFRVRKLDVPIGQRCYCCLVALWGQISHKKVLTLERETGCDWSRAKNVRYQNS
jgi:hypothetical protein